LDFIQGAFSVLDPKILSLRGTFATRSSAGPSLFSPKVVFHWSHCVRKVGTPVNRTVAYMTPKTNCDSNALALSAKDVDKNLLRSEFRRLFRSAFNLGPIYCTKSWSCPSYEHKRLKTLNHQYLDPTPCNAGRVVCWHRKTSRLRPAYSCSPIESSRWYSFWSVSRL
jgi:hypothetical protein